MTDYRILKTVGATAAALCLAAPAMAQSSDGATAAPDGSMQMQRADQVTCQHLSEMDANAMETTLYYIAGYKRGQDDAMNLSGSGGMETSSATTGTLGSATGAADTDTTASTTGTTAGTVTTDTADTTTAMNETGGGTGTDLGGTQVPDSATGTTAVGDTAGSVGASGGATDGSDIDGFFAIPVAQVTVTCLDDPSRSVTDVIDEQRGAANN